jgi:peptidoglycan/xylan/chitin deacetylase (PgdA/CDA1 family)
MAAFHQSKMFSLLLALCYHAVSESWQSELSVTPDRLREQVRAFVRRGFEPLTFTEAVLSPRPRTLVVTFDDAYLSIPELALPVLAEMGVPATIFVPTAGTGQPSVRAWPGIDGWIGSSWETELTGATWTELDRLIEAGWEIGSHTRTHARLTQISDEQLWDELAGSREDCAAATGLPCRSIAYPYGDADARVAEAAERVGYEAGALLTDGIPKSGKNGHDPMMWPRLGVYENDRPPRLRLKSEAFLHAARLWNLAQRARGVIRR